MPAKNSKGCCCPPCRGSACCCQCFPDTLCVRVQASGAYCSCDQKAEAGWNGLDFRTFVDCGPFVVGVKVSFSRDPYDGVCRLCLEVECSGLKTVYCRRFGYGELYRTCDEAFAAPWLAVDISACGSGCTTATITLTQMERVVASCNWCGCMPRCLCATIIDTNGYTQCVKQALACWYSDFWQGGFDCPSVPYFKLYFEPTISPLFPGSCDLILSIPHCGVSKRLTYGEYSCVTAVFSGLDLRPCGGGNPATIAFVPAPCEECGFGICCGGVLPGTLNIEVTTDDGSSSGTLTFNPLIGVNGGCWVGDLVLHCSAGPVYPPFNPDRTLHVKLC